MEREERASGAPAALTRRRRLRGSLTMVDDRSSRDVLQTIELLNTLLEPRHPPKDGHWRTYGFSPTAALAGRGPSRAGRCSRAEMRLSARLRVCGKEVSPPLRCKRPGLSAQAPSGRVQRMACHQPQLGPGQRREAGAGRQAGERASPSPKPGPPASAALPGGSAIAHTSQRSRLQARQGQGAAAAAATACAPLPPTAAPRRPGAAYNVCSSMLEMHDLKA